MTCLPVRIVAALTAAICGLLATAPVARADDNLGVTWVSGTTNLDWQGHPYVTSETSFFGDRVVVPGDRIARTVRITNTADADGLLSVQVRNVRLSDNEPGTSNLRRLTTLSWKWGTSAGGTSLGTAVGDTAIAQALPLAKGAYRDLTLILSFPAKDTQGYRSAKAIAKTTISFDVELSIHGTTAIDDRPLIRTGLGTGFEPWEIVLGALIGATLLVIALRRRSEDDEPADVPRPAAPSPEPSGRSPDD